MFSLSRKCRRVPEFPSLHIPAAFHGLEHCDLVGVFDVAANRNAHGDARDFHACPLQLLREIGRSRFAFHRGIRGHDDFVDLAGVDAGDEIRDAQLLRSNSM